MSATESRIAERLVAVPRCSAAVVRLTGRAAAQPGGLVATPTRKVAP